nr:ribonuclease H-like domain, reverse transcriptase, RNA-dependent DNA polymerase [Tanacetum cinerariifolium]
MKRLMVDMLPLRETPKEEKSLLKTLNVLFCLPTLSYLMKVKSCLEFQERTTCTVLINLYSVDLRNVAPSGGNQTNGNAGTKVHINVGKAEKKTVSGPQYVLLSLLTSDSQGLKSLEDEVTDDAGKERRERAQRNEIESMFGQDKDANGNMMFIYDDEVKGAEADFNNLELTTVVFAPVARIEAIRLFLVYALFMGFNVYQMDVKSAFLYGIIEEEVYVCQPPGFEDPYFPNKVYKVEKALYGLHQVPGAWINVQEVPDEFYEGAYFLLSVAIKTASTPIETNKALLKDEEAVDVDVHLYRSMIGSLMYLTAFRPGIMFAVCACARF